MFANDDQEEVNIQNIQQLIQLNIKTPKQSHKRWALDLNEHFSREDIQTTNTRVKRCSTLLITREMQIKITMIYHLTLVRISITKQKKDNKYGEKGILVHYSGNINWYSLCRKQ